MHIVATPQGILKSRTVKRQPVQNQFDLTKLSKMRGVPWNPTASTAEVGVEVLVKEHPRDDTARQQKGRAADLELKQFQEAFGKTRGCRVCVEPKGNHHMKECKMRREEFRFREALREHEEEMARQNKEEGREEPR